MKEIQLELRKEIQKLCKGLGVEVTFDGTYVSFGTVKGGDIEGSCVFESTATVEYAGVPAETAYFRFVFCSSFGREYTSYYGVSDGLHFDTEKVKGQRCYVTTFDVEVSYCPTWDRNWSIEMLESLLRDIFKITRKLKKVS
jgi:hypothetical protein